LILSWFHTAVTPAGGSSCQSQVACQLDGISAAACTTTFYEVWILCEARTKN
jgi:hypothetical protein